MTDGIKSHYEVVVVGAGVSGIYQIKRLADLGVDALVLDAAPDLGGTWYWNRYPGRAFQFRELHLRLFVLEGTAQRVALEGAVFGAAGEPALSQLRRRQVRPSQIHAVQSQGRGGGLRRGQQSVAAQARRRLRADLPVRHSRGRVAGDADAAAAGRHGDVQGPLVPHVLLAARAGRTGRQEGRHHRHRRHRDPGDRRDRGQGRRVDRVSAPSELERAAQQRPDLRRGDGRHSLALRRDFCRLHPHARRLRA